MEPADIWVSVDNSQWALFLLKELVWVVPQVHMYLKSKLRDRDDLMKGLGGLYIWSANYTLHNFQYCNQSLDFDLV